MAVHSEVVAVTVPIVVIELKVTQVVVVVGPVGVIVTCPLMPYVKELIEVTVEVVVAQEDADETCGSPQVRPARQEMTSNDSEAAIWLFSRRDSGTWSCAVQRCSGTKVLPMYTYFCADRVKISGASCERQSTKCNVVPTTEVLPADLRVT